MAASITSGLEHSRPSMVRYHLMQHWMQPSRAMLPYHEALRTVSGLILLIVQDPREVLVAFMSSLSTVYEHSFMFGEKFVMDESSAKFEKMGFVRI